MDHQRLKPIKGASAREKTAFTLKTIQELLAEELAVPEAEEPAAEPKAEATAAEAKPEAAVAPKKPKVKADAFPKIAPLKSEDKPAAKPAKKSSLFGRFIGR